MQARELIQKFVTKVRTFSEKTYTSEDEQYLFNVVLDLVGEDDETPVVAQQTTTLIDLKEALVQLAIDHQKIQDLTAERDILGAKLMDLITPLPSAVNKRFWALYDKDPERALTYFYELSQANDYIKVAAIAKNIAYDVATKYGNLEITINLSKPEKDPKQIALAKTMKQTGYPKCQLCIENEGYTGRLDFPARRNHRIIRFELAGQTWGFQYSPYAYFNEHSIFLDGKHEPMVINAVTFKNLLQIVKQFPGYFAGSNADLPIVGGSILTHEHYQGGRHDFPMAKARIETPLHFAGYDDIQAGIVKWPMSVIRLTSSNAQQLETLAAHILTQWQNYSDPSVQILAHSADGTPHHTITPIARMRDGQFELDLVLRDNQTSTEYPDGIYHPHADVQHIKKENIGLIEVMGLAILPPRLKDEMAEVEKYLCDQPNKMAAYHQTWADQIKADNSEITMANVTQLVQNEVGKVFMRVLEDAGVFKRDPQGKAAFIKFTQDL
ncbi:UDP-glucose--hexose-1-phosphate uridylyltransferase [Latilactobacillus graminis]|uniref:Galactose-1-phosphate uridylyltransferase n=2 Tax=Latilactobacillus graminis TaxID=60519 RepID=A0AA89I1E0_9LACO|nr:UDP-glucose--hexose-1-phosphate uridylyltransferase [Latilactobacillus graminis]KRM23894.1 galT protein [Latilactobacillus graminis DSM 20719]QFP79783.1 UDP-glucose--hexose-1-phosphate uridylyltransferase [Latilactobacillus graminis]